MIVENYAAVSKVELGSHKVKVSRRLQTRYHESISVTKTEMSDQFRSVINEDFQSEHELISRINQESCKEKNWLVLVFNSNRLELDIKTVNSELELDSEEEVIMSLFNDQTDKDNRLYDFIDWDEVEKNYRVASYI